METKFTQLYGNLFINAKKLHLIILSEENAKTTITFIYENKMKSIVLFPSDQKCVSDVLNRKLGDTFCQIESYIINRNNIIECTADDKELSILFTDYSHVIQTGNARNLYKILFGQEQDDVDVEGVAI